jgi:hypothetical protein
MTVRVPALGGVREVPEPDPIAREYLLLALRLEQRLPGLVDGYFGPADLKARVDTEHLPSPARLLDDARSLSDRIDADVDARRARWLRAQLRALETHAASLTGESLPYVEHVERCFDWRPQAHDDTEFEPAAAEIGRLLPGDGPLVERLAAWDEQFVIEPSRSATVVDWLVDRDRERARTLFALPEGEDVRVSLVHNKPWSGYNWFDGGLRSRVEINLDLPVRAHELLRVVAHETYPGHHLEHAWKEADLVERQGLLESSVLLINAPECLISEGLAELGNRFASPPADEPALLVELYQRAELPVANDPARARSEAERSVRISAARDVLSGVRVNAALMLHAEGRDMDAVRDYYQGVGLVPPARIDKRLEFLSHPLWRTYVFVYSEGEALLARWLEMVPVDERPARFGRLLHEQVTPGSILAEIESGAGEP